MMTSATLPDVFFDAKWSHRGWRISVVIVVFGLGALLLLWSSTKTLLHPDLRQNDRWFDELIFAAIGLFFAIIALYSLQKVIWNAGVTSRIDTTGISMGRKHWPWSRMRFIRFDTDSLGGINLTIGLQRQPDRMFWIGRPLNQKEYQRLSEQLMPFLKAHYPHLIQ